MRTLELKVPPPLVWLVAVLAMWGIARLTPSIDVPGRFRVSATIVLSLAGLGTAMSGALAFRRAKTTTNPLKPETSSALVTSGVYRRTRNPMYVGLAIVLVAWAVFLSSGWSLVAVPIFVLYMTRFQIVPEERVLSRLFGDAYSAYRAKVRRWI